MKNPQILILIGAPGSGKSTLINDILAKELHAQLLRASQPSGKHRRIDGIDNLDKIVIIDQSPIGFNRYNKLQKGIHLPIY